MEEIAHPCVVVGIDDSVHGLAALRAAVAEARHRRVPLHAIHSCNTVQLTEVLDTIRAAFLEALGEIHDDVQIHLTASCVPAHRVLTDSARDPRDLIVVGNSGKGWWRALWSGSITRGVIRRARCPILAVPAPEAVRAVHPPKRPRADRPGRQDLWEQFDKSVPEPRGTRHIDG